MQSPYKPNTVHHWLAGKRLVTQNINGLDGKAGNAAYVPIQGRLDKVTVLHEQGPYIFYISIIILLQSIIKKKLVQLTRVT